MAKQILRQWVWDELTRTGQAAFPRPVHGRIPAFVGAGDAAARIRDLPEYQRAQVVKVGLGEIDPIDLVVAGSVAVSHAGARTGKGEGYGDMEFALLCEMGKLTPSTPVITSVHDLQVTDSPGHPLGAEVPWDPHDISVDIILTPTRTIRTQRQHPQPSRIDWDLLTEERIRELQPLLELRKQNRPPSS